MLQKLGDHIANCLSRATEAEQRAAETSDNAMRLEHERIAHTWRHLARSYQFVESLERFLLDANKAAHPPDPPVETQVPTFPPSGTTFDPETIAALAAAYDNAVGGQPTAVHEIIAKHIIELASDGERDPYKLCQSALALSARSPRSTGW